tara:strand:- start:189561 stop:189977 length:417 start_codon:yes stop_codon:yes gene_type:complete
MGNPIMEPQDLIEISYFRGWIRFRRFCLNMYARRTKRWINQELMETVDLANFDVDPEVRGEGNLTRFLDEIEKLADHNKVVVYVESILNERLYDFLMRRGYIMACSPECLFRPLGGSLCVAEQNQTRSSATSSRHHTS